MNRRNKTNILVQTENFNSSGLTRTRAAFPAIVSVRNHQAGFTIVEVVVAILVFSIGLVAIAGMQTHSIGQATFSDQMSTRISSITHRAETLKRQPLKEESVTVGDYTIDVEVSSLFKEENMCEYGKPCEWSYVDYEEDKPHVVRQRILQGYPLPNLVMVELETAPRHVATKTAERRTIRVAYLRSNRWN